MTKQKLSKRNCNQAKPIILDDNPYSIMRYAKEHPKKFDEISKSLDSQQKFGEKREK